MAATQPGWRPDPYGRAARRYWDGERWTARVRSGDVPSGDGGGDGDESVDPLGATATIPFTAPTGITTGVRTGATHDGEPGSGRHLLASLVARVRRLFSGGSGARR